MICKICTAHFGSEQVLNPKQAEAYVCRTCWTKTFSIALITREHLANVLEPEEISRFGNGDMGVLAELLDPIAWWAVRAHYGDVARQILDDK
jgi:hypothetical protein